MPINPCRNSKCEYFNKSLPSTAKVCPMCGEPLGNAFPPSSAPAPQPIPNESPAPQPPVYQPPAPQPPVYQPPAPQPPAYQPPTPSPSQRDYSPPPVPAPAPAPIPYAAPQSRPALKLIHSTGREFCLPSEGGVMGRHSPSNPSIPEIDLAGISDEGVVSRIHARFYWDAGQNAYMITDNSSRNGTSLNGMSLKPGIAYRVDQGMSLQLGQDNLVSFRIVVG